MEGRMLLGGSGGGSNNNNRGGQPIENMTRGHNSHLVDSEFVPRFDWSETPEAHILIADLPGFRKEDVSVQIDNWGNLTISGHRPSQETTTVGWGPWQRTQRRPGQAFRKLFSTPDNVNFDAISAKFEHQILYVIIPKLEAPHPEIPEDQPLREVEGSSPVDAEIPPAPAEAEGPPMAMLPEGDDLNQRGRASEAEHIQIPRKEDHVMETSKAGGEGEDQKAIPESNEIQGTVTPPTVQEKGPPPELNREAQHRELSDRDQEPSPVKKIQEEGSNELPPGSSISEEKPKAPDALPGPAEAENGGDGVNGQAAPPALDQKSADDRKQAHGRRFKLPGFSKRNAVLVSSVIVLSLGLYISYRLRSTDD